MSRFRLTSPKYEIAESEVAKACKAVLAYRGYWVARLHAGLYKTWDGKRIVKGVDVGVPDYVTCHAKYPGFLLEVKRTGGEPTREQHAKHREIRQGYSLAICVADSAMGLLDWLNQHEQRVKELWR